MHQLAADIKSQSAALCMFCVDAPPEAFKNMRQFCIGKSTAAVPDGNQNASLFLGKVNGNAFSIAVFYSILHYILQHLNTAVRVTLQQAIGIAADQKLCFYQCQLFAVIFFDASDQF